MEEKNTIDLAISNLEATSNALEKAANDPKNYNTLFAGYLDVISYETRRMANELKYIDVW
jgi:hypothetical protein